MSKLFRDNYPINVLLCPGCLKSHMTQIGYDTSVQGRVDIVFRCLECLAVNTLYVVKDGTITVIGWADQRQFKKERADVSRFKREMAAMGWPDWPVEQ
jgi:hypothetical protein